MNISGYGKNLIKSFESCRLTSYKAVPTEEYYTIGWGHYGSDVYNGMTITQSQADTMFDSDIVKYVNAVKSAPLGFKPNQNQFDALCSFCYNLGTGILTDFTGLSATQVSAEITKYVYSGGVILPGLVTRRNQEVKVFNWYPEDVNKDGLIDILDLSMVSADINKTSNDPSWKAELDVNSDGVIDILDMSNPVH